MADDRDIFWITEASEIEIHAWSMVIDYEGDEIIPPSKIKTRKMMELYPSIVWC